MDTESNNVLVYMDGAFIGYFFIGWIDGFYSIYVSVGLHWTYMMATNAYIT